MSRGFQAAQLKAAVKICIRADASGQIGGGHVMRCLTLADALSRRGAKTSFISQDMSPALAAKIEEGGHELRRFDATLSMPGSPDLWLASDAERTAQVVASHPCDWLFVDHYSIDHRWERELAGVAPRMLVVDDLANRRHECDLLLDQNYYSDAATRYESLVPASTRCLLGPNYAMLRPQFLAARHRLAEHGSGHRLFVSFGAADSHGLCARVVEALRILGDSAPGAEIVVGVDEALRAQIAAAAAGLRDVNVHGFVDNVAEIMARCTIAVGAGGSSTLERCAVGIASIVVVVADNQRRMVDDLVQTGAVRVAGEAADVTKESFVAAIRELMSNPALHAEMQRISMQLVDGRGTDRVVAKIEECS